MKQLRYLDLYHLVEEKFTFHVAWLYDESKTWGLGIKMAREDSVELSMPQKQDTPSILDTLGVTTLPFILQLLSATHTEVHQAELRALPQFPAAWYGVLTMTSAGHTFELTARKGLLISLALRTRSQLVIGDDLLEEKGVRLPPGVSLDEWLAQPDQARLYEPIRRANPPSAITGMLQEATQQHLIQPLNEEQRQQVLDQMKKHITPQDQARLKQLWQTNPELRERSTDMWKKLGFNEPPLLEQFLYEDDDAGEQ